MQSWDREFVFSDEQKREISSLLPKSATNPGEFIANIEIGAQSYRGLAWTIRESGLEVRPNESTSLLSAISKKAQSLAEDLSKLGPLSGRGLIESAIYHRNNQRAQYFVVEKMIEDLRSLAQGSSDASVAAGQLKPLNPERFLVGVIKRHYAEHVGVPGTSRNCRCYRIAGLVLAFAGKHLDDWYHLYGAE